MAVTNGSSLHFLQMVNMSDNHVLFTQNDQYETMNHSANNVFRLVQQYPWTSCALISGSSIDAIKNNYMDLFNMCGTPILVVLGIILNILAFIILHHKDFRDSSTMFFMAMLAFSNVMTLVLVNGIGWFVEMTGTPSIATYHDSICKLWHLIIRVIQFSSVWFIVAMIIDQYMTLKYGAPKAQQKGGSASLCMARLVTVSIYVGMTVINIHAMWLFELPAQMNICQIPAEHDAMYITAWKWVSATASVYLPIMLLFIFTILLIFRLFHFKQTGFSVEDWKVCRATVVVSGLFLLLCLPSTVINILRHTGLGPHTDGEVTLRILCAQYVASWCPQFNIALVFFIYVIFVPRFGKELISFLRKMRKRKQKGYNKKSPNNNSLQIEATHEMANTDLVHGNGSSNDGLEALLKPDTNGCNLSKKNIMGCPDHSELGGHGSPNTVTVWVHMDDLQNSRVTSNCALNGNGDHDVVVSSV